MNMPTPVVSLIPTARLSSDDNGATTARAAAAGSMRRPACSAL